MNNCIESDALMEVCRAIGFGPYMICSALTIMDDIYIVSSGSIDKMEIPVSGVSNYTTVEAFKLSEYLLATAPVDINKD